MSRDYEEFRSPERKSRRDPRMARKEEPARRMGTGRQTGAQRQDSAKEAGRQAD